MHTRRTHMRLTQGSMNSPGPWHSLDDIVGRRIVMVYRASVSCFQARCKTELYPGETSYEGDIEGRECDLAA
jgi:hypothetical protein